MRYDFCASLYWYDTTFCKKSRFSTEIDLGRVVLLPGRSRSVRSKKIDRLRTLFPIKLFIPFIKFLYQFFVSQTLFLLRGRNTIVLNRTTTWQRTERIPFKKGLNPKKAISRLMNTIPSIKHSSLSSSSWQHSSWGHISTHTQKKKISLNIKRSYNFLPF